MGQAVISTFQRYEHKYFLTPAQLEGLRPVLETHMAVDSYGKHTICNIFFDTDDFAVVRASIEKPVYKEKLRVRSYGIPDPDTGLVFIELKKKFKRCVYKRRIAVTVGEAHAFLSHGEPPASADPQITAEIADFLRRYRPEPKVFLAYDRVALFGKEDPELRLTLDTGIRWRDTELELCDGDFGDPVLQDDRILMETKIAQATPLWMAHAFSELGIFRTSFSKYGTCYQEYLLPNLFERRICTHV